MASPPVSSPGEPSLRDFWQALWPEMPLPGRAVVWTLSKKQHSNESFWCEGFEDIEVVVKRYSRQRHIYFGIAQQDPEKALVIARHRKPQVELSSVRGSSASTVAIPGLWVDIDIRADAHSSQALPPDEASALRLLEAIPLPPTVIIHTGYGFHAYWLFHEPWIFDADQEREEAASLVRRLQRTIRIEGEKAGWTVDSTADLARALRLPTTLNHKGIKPRPVTFHLFEPERRYDPADFEDKLAEATPVQSGGTPPPPSMDTGLPADIEAIRQRCAWMGHCYESRAHLTEPVWYGVLSIVSRCADGYDGGRDLAHRWSQGHPGYSQEETDRKHDQALSASGPRTCTHIAQQLGAYETFCHRCEHWELIKSPIVLGRQQQVSRQTRYKATSEGLILLKPTKDGPVPVGLTNFVARIRGEVIHDDGAETTRSFEIEARHQDRQRRFTVSATDFAGMAWVMEKLGPTAVVQAGTGTKDHARVAIQTLSENVSSTTVFTHIGWRETNGTAAYLHAGGAIGPVGPVAEVEVDPPSALELFELPGLPADEKLTQCIRASLEILDLLPDPVVVPLYCGIWRAISGSCDFSLHLAGQTGEGKSEMAALVQQHWGPGLDARHLPASWSSTGNALEILAFAAKDAVLVIDDFAPEGSPAEVRRLHGQASRLLRAQGNKSGRQRLRSDASLRPNKGPRGLILSTGEDIPKAQSIRARMLTLEMPVGGLDWKHLSRCQEQASQGTYAQALAGFARWLAPQVPELDVQRRQRVTALRQRAMDSGGLHRRTPAIVAELAFGLELFLSFTREVGALDESVIGILWERSWTALGQAAAAQAAHIVAEDPIRRFLDLLRSSLTAGAAHLVAADGGAPEKPRACGWRARAIGSAPFTQGDWEPRGDQIGWIMEQAIFLDPTAAFRVAQRMAPNDGIAITPQTLWKRLRERGLLASSDTKRERNTVRKTLQGSRRKVVHLLAETLLPQEPSQPAQLSQGEAESAVPGTVPRAGLEPTDQEPAQPTGPEPLDLSTPGTPPGPVGTVGTVSETSAARTSIEACKMDKQNDSHGKENR